MVSYLMVGVIWFSFFIVGNILEIFKLVILQKRGLLLIYFVPSDAHATGIPLFIESKLLTVNMIHFDTVVKLMHDIW